MGIIVALLGALVSIRIRGSTPAEGVCRLTHNDLCLQLAERGEVQVKAAERRFLPSTSAPQAARRETREARPSRTPAVAKPMAPASPATPLDQHTPTERKALDRILIQHGSR